MKRILIIILCGFMMIGITGCGKKEKVNNIGYVQIDSESDIKITNRGVDFKLKEETLTNSNGVFIIENNSDFKVGYGESYGIEKEVDGKWYNLKTISDRVFNVPLYTLYLTKSAEEYINFEYGYGKLTSGKYRVVKDALFLYDNDKTEDFLIAVEFTIE